MKFSYIILVSVIFLFLTITSCSNEDPSRTIIDQQVSTDNGEEDTQKTSESVAETEEKTVAETTTKYVELASLCDRVLYTKDVDGDKYEIVMNEKAGYPKTTFECGIIKNNEWLINMGTECPFMMDESTFYGIDPNSSPLNSIRFEYLNEGCFLYSTTAITNRPNMIFNPQTGVAFKAGRIESIYRTSVTIRYNEVVNNGIAIAWGPEWGSGLHAFNMITGEDIQIPLGEKKAPSEIWGYYDGLFAMIGDGYYGFFDLEGNEVIDLYSQFGTRGNHNNPHKFVNGQYTFETYNENNQFVKITINKSGEILKVE